MLLVVVPHDLPWCPLGLPLDSYLPPGTAGAVNVHDGDMFVSGSYRLDVFRWRLRFPSLVIGGISERIRLSTPMRFNCGI